MWIDSAKIELKKISNFLRCSIWYVSMALAEEVAFHFNTDGSIPIENRLTQKDNFLRISEGWERLSWMVLDRSIDPNAHNDLLFKHVWSLKYDRVILSASLSVTFCREKKICFGLLEFFLWPSNKISSLLSLKFSDNTKHGWMILNVL